MNASALRALGHASALRALGADFTDMLLGRACPGCGGPVPREAKVCERCDERVPRTGVVLCLHCMQEGSGPGGAPTIQAGPRARAGGCLRHGSERLLLAGPSFEPPLDRVIHAFKYSGARALHRWVAGLLPEPPGRGTEAWREYALVPAPLHPARRAWRGFDQARLLAETAGAAWGIPVAAVLERRRDTPPQAKTGAGERRANVRGAFALTPEGARLAAGRALLLVDDVATTGSTLLEAAAALEPARPAWVLALTAAHGGLAGVPETTSPARVAAPRRL